MDHTLELAKIVWGMVDKAAAPWSGRGTLTVSYITPGVYVWGDEEADKPIEVEWFTFRLYEGLHLHPVLAGQSPLRRLVMWKDHVIAELAPAGH